MAPLLFSDQTAPDAMVTLLAFIVSCSPKKAKVAAPFSNSAWVEPVDVPVQVTVGVLEKDDWKPVVVTLNFVLPKSGEAGRTIDATVGVDTVSFTDGE